MKKRSKNVKKRLWIDTLFLGRKNDMSPASGPRLYPSRRCDHLTTRDIAFTHTLEHECSLQKSFCIGLEILFNHHGLLHRLAETDHLYSIPNSNIPLPHLPTYNYHNVTVFFYLPWILDFHKKRHIFSPLTFFEKDPRHSRSNIWHQWGDRKRGKLLHIVLQQRDQLYFLLLFFFSIYTLHH